MFGRDLMLEQTHGLSGPFSAGEIAAMVASNGLVAMWDTFVAATVTLNGADVSALADLTGLGNSVAQATPANQPLYTGAPTFNGWRSIQFTAANLDTLIRANTNMVSGPLTVLTAQRFRAAGGTQFVLGNGDALTNGIALGMLAGNRCCNHVNNTNYSDAVPSNAVPEVWLATDLTTSSVPILTVNGSPAVLSGAASIRIPSTGTSTLAIGASASGFNADVDFLFGAVFTTILSGPLQTSLVNRLKARLGL